MGDATLQFYEQLADDYHLIFADWHESVRRQGGIFDRLIRTVLGDGAQTVLDCACGIGTQAIGLALHGHRVHATDLSPTAVARAQLEAVAFGVNISFGVADFRTLATQVKGEYDVVIACDNSLPHLLTDTDLQRAAHNIYTKVASGGLFIASIRDYDQLAQERPRAMPVSVRDTPEGRRIVFQIWDWAADGRSYTLGHFILKDKGDGWETLERISEYRALLRHELDAALQEAGFSNIRWLMLTESGYYQPIVIAHKEVAT